jgi:hypothetical protein
MYTQEFRACVTACYACAKACDDCAKGCVNEANPRPLDTCISLSTDCAQICRMAAAYVERNSNVASFICRACADICEGCQEECGKYQMDYCQACMEACHNCVEACRFVVQHVGNQSDRQDSVIAGLRQ